MSSKMAWVVLPFLSILLHLATAQIYLSCYGDEINLPHGCTCVNPQNPIVSCESQGLTGIPNVTRALSLNLRNNSISSLPANAFAHISGLKKIYLSNNKIKLFDSNAFATLDLEVLDLSRNRLRAIPDLFAEATTSLQNLRELKLSNNYISSIADEAFKGLPNLQYVYLGGNPVNVIGPDAWLGLRRLQLLDLSADSFDIMKIPTDNLQNITMLFLSGAKVKRLDVMGAWFESFPQLRHLELNDMGLRDFHLMRGHFPAVWKAQLLGISFRGNELTKIPLRLLNFPLLQELDLSRNLIERILYPSGQERLPFHIVKFNISSNALTYINTAQIMSLSNALEIDLRNNYLTGISWSSSAINRSLRSGAILYLGGNPWSCRCGTMWLKDLADGQVTGSNRHMTSYEINNTYRCGPRGTHNQELISKVPRDIFDCSK